MIYGKLTLGISSAGGMACLQVWRVAAWLSFFFFFSFCSQPQITDLKTCVKFTRAVYVTDCKRWKYAPRRTVQTALLQTQNWACCTLE